MKRDKESDIILSEIPKKPKKRITKEEFEKLISLRNSLISSKGKVFGDISEDALTEWSKFHPCEKCNFLSKECHRTCGVVMKWRHKAGHFTNSPSFGNRNRIVSEKEFTDTSSVNLGVSEEVDRINDMERNHELLSESDEISLSDLSEYDIDDSEYEDNY